MNEFLLKYEIIRRNGVSLHVDRLVEKYFVDELLQKTIPTACS